MEDYIMNGQYPNNNQNNQQQPQQPQQNYQQPQQNFQQPQQNPYQQPYQQNPYQQPASVPGKGFSIAALVTGIVGVVFCWTPGFNIVVLVCSILGIIFGVKGRQMSLQATGKASGLATAGLVLGIIGASFAGIGVLCTTACICAGNSFVDALGSSMSYYI